MGRRSRSDVVWQPVKPRRRGAPLVLLGIAAAVAFVGYMYARVWESSGAGPVPASYSVAAEAQTDQPVRQRRTHSLSLSTAPRASPSPREAVSPRRAPLPRGEVREAAVGSDR